MKYSILFLAGLLFSTCSIAQCLECEAFKDKASDFCYSSESFDQYCASFSASASSYLLAFKKKTKEIPSVESYDQDYFISLAGNSKLKLKAMEILFLQEATEKWSVESRKYGHTYTDSGLGYKILKQGTGELPVKGEMVNVHYTGYLEDGTRFDSSYDRNRPFNFVLGQGQVIKGWDQGVALLKKGTKALLRVPPNLAYGERARGPIPANATLFFEIEVME